MRLYTRPTALLLSCSLLFLSACKKEDLMPKPAAPAAGEQATRRAVTENEARQFAEQLSQALQAQDLQRIDRLLHMTELLERIGTDLNMSTVERRAYVSVALKKMGTGGIGRDILAVLANGGSYKLLHVDMVRGHPRPVFRMLRPEGGFNYHAYALVSFPGGIGMEDVYVFGTGEWLSDEMRREAKAILARARQGRHVKGPDDPETRGAGKLQEMKWAMLQGDFVKAAAAYRDLPEWRQNDKAVLIGYTLALGRQGQSAEKEYAAALAKLAKLFPDDPSVDLCSFHYYITAKQYDRALKALDRLDRAVGGDPHLSSVRGHILVLAERFDEARAAAEKAVKEEPTLESGYWVRILVSLHEEKYGETLEWLKKLVQTCQTQVADLAAIPEYAGFVQSPQYREWQKWYAARLKK
jgi:tetratricopeptide (TPR) repeat protein